MNYKQLIVSVNIYAIVYVQKANARAKEIYVNLQDKRAIMAISFSYILKYNLSNAYNNHLMGSMKSRVIKNFKVVHSHFAYYICIPGVQCSIAQKYTSGA